jgi:2-polyprenyl-3-methyl-5-hydroxy-6-metoxy-1,4-benzoquinol methylase
MKVCVVCGNRMTLKHQLRFQIYQCRKCNLLTSNAIFNQSFLSYNTEVRETGIKQLRVNNFESIIQHIIQQKAKISTPISGLEIGSGIGWWLETCKNHNISCIGIEPEKNFEAYHNENKLSVIYDFYPLTKNKLDKKFDFIIFNDVLEHIADIHSLIWALDQNLKEDGIIIINLPLSTGIFYRSATFFHKIGVRSFLERMWQFSFHSPHMHYFNEKNIKQLFDRYGFTSRTDFSLNSIETKNLKERIITDRSYSKIRGYLIAKLIFLLNPILNNCTPDIKVFFFTRK